TGAGSLPPGQTAASGEAGQLDGAMAAGPLAASLQEVDEVQPVVAVVAVEVAVRAAAAAQQLEHLVADGRLEAVNLTGVLSHEAVARGEHGVLAQLESVTGQAIGHAHAARHDERVLQH